MTTRRTIIVSPNPRGVFLEGIINGTPKPGTCVSQKSDGEYEAWNGGADGERDLVAILLEDRLQGGTVDDAYVSGTRCYMYVPAAGEEFLMLLANIAGTGDAFAIGDKLIIDDGTGKLIATTGSPEMEPFKVREAQTALTADTLVLCQYTGQ